MKANKLTYEAKASAEIGGKKGIYVSRFPVNFGGDFLVESVALLFKF